LGVFIVIQVVVSQKERNLRAIITYRKKINCSNFVVKIERTIIVAKKKKRVDCCANKKKVVATLCYNKDKDRTMVFSTILLLLL
jgi:hypothetical protein